MSGLILIDRSILKHHIVGIKNPLRFSAWCWMLAKARYKPGTYFDAGHEIPLKVGQFVCGRKFMSDETGMTEKQVRVFLAALERSDMVTKTVHKKGQGITIVTICNYSKYQSFDEYRATKGPSKGPPKGQGRAKVGPHSVTPEETTDVTTVKRDHSSQAILMFNEIAKKAGWSKVQNLSQPRKKALLSRIKDVGGLDNWHEAIIKASQSDFLIGNNDRGWKATFDWLCAPKNFIKLMEGNYDDRNSNGANLNSKGLGLAGVAMRNQIKNENRTDIPEQRGREEEDNGLFGITDRRVR